MDTEPTTPRKTLREMIDSANDLKHEDVVVPEWGGSTVRIAELSAGERGEWEDAEQAEASAPVNRLLYTARFLTWCLRDPATGARLYRLDEAEALLKGSPRVIVRLFAIAARLNGADDAPPATTSPTGPAGEGAT